MLFLRILFEQCTCYVNLEQYDMDMFFTVQYIGLLHLALSERMSRTEQYINLSFLALLERFVLYSAAH